MRVQTLAPLLLLSLLAWASPAHAARSYDNCTGYITSVPAVISTPGTWCLNQDVTTAITSGDAITVASSNVVLDCNDFRLDGLAGGTLTQAFGVHSTDESNVRIRHCNIRGFYRGVYLQGTGGRHVVEDNHFDRNTYVAMRLEGDGSLIRHNLVTATGGAFFVGPAYGIVAQGTTDILDNTIDGVFPAPGTTRSAYGMSLVGNVGGDISGNRVERLVPTVSGHAWGIVTSPPMRLAVRHNQLVGPANNGTGVSCQPASGVDQTVRVRDNVISGFFDQNSTCGDAGRNTLVP